jgi:hypothetical protein
MNEWDNESTLLLTHQQVELVQVDDCMTVSPVPWPATVFRYTMALRAGMSGPGPI